MRETVRSLLAAWAMLMALTLALAVAGDVNHPSRLGPVWIVVIALAAAAKARIVLRSYLGLYAAPAALAGFTFAIVLTLAIVSASFLLFTTPPRQASARDNTQPFSLTADCSRQACGPSGIRGPLIDGEARRNATQL